MCDCKKGMTGFQWFLVVFLSLCFLLLFFGCRTTPNGTRLDPQSIQEVARAVHRVGDEVPGPAGDIIQFVAGGIGLFGLAVGAWQTRGKRRMRTGLEAVTGGVEKVLKQLQPEQIVQAKRTLQAEQDAVGTRDLVNEVRENSSADSGQGGPQKEGVA